MYEIMSFNNMVFRVKIIFLKDTQITKISFNNRLGTAFPDAKEHVTSKLEDVTESLTTLVSLTQQCSQQLELAEQLQAYFDTYHELL